MFDSATDTVRSSSIDPVEKYVDFFNDLCAPDQIFEAFRDQVREKSPARAKVIGALWYHLSEAIVDILCVALAKLETPQIRHLVAQTVYEELGEASPDQIHTDLLRQMLRVADVTDVDILRYSGHKGINEAIDGLMGRLHACQSDAEVCGLLLGMELIAYQNVDNVIDYLSYDSEVGTAVSDTPWARLHHQLEEGHIRRAVSIFVDHVTALHDQRQFTKSFMATMRFWSEFWSSIAAEATGRPLAVSTE